MNRYQKWVKAWELHQKPGSFVYVRGHKLEIGHQAQAFKVQARIAIHYFLYTDSYYA